MLCVPVFAGTLALHSQQNGGSLTPTDDGELPALPVPEISHERLVWLPDAESGGGRYGSRYVGDARNGDGSGVVNQYIEEYGLWNLGEAVSADGRLHLSPAVTMSSAAGVYAEHESGKTARAIVLPNNTLNIWHINISNGSAGNWGSYPGSLLDARTLSFPTP